MIEMHELMANNYHYILKHTEEGEAALNYLKSRGFTEELINDRKMDMHQIIPNSRMTFREKWL